MPIISPSLTNSFRPSTVSSSTASRRYGDNDSGEGTGQENPFDFTRLGGASQAVRDFISTNGSSNPPFNTSTGGIISPAQGPGKITRGFVRRSSPDSGDLMSLSQLNFMYNPAEITRDYVSYLDQAALDPFNTIYQSGNLVVAPNFINFSFSLVFDRQIDELKVPYADLGVLMDYRYFDMVVRNVPPMGGSAAVPDNGIMMANPKDITVVFSKDLTVQGRATNARVQFVKFSHDMVPTRMVVSLTMIITYFGPLKQAYGFDSKQTIAKYEALVPYNQVYSETYTKAELDAAVDAQRAREKATLEESEAAPKANPYSYGEGEGAAGVAAAGVTNIGLVGNGSVQARTLEAGKIRADIANAGIGYTYSSPTNRTGGPSGHNYDCSGFVSMCYQDAGASDVLGGREIDTRNFYNLHSGEGWKRMGLVVSGTNSADSIKANCQPGDILLRHGVGNRPNHMSMVNDVTNNTLSVMQATSYPKPRGTCGVVPLSDNYLNSYNYLCRPSGTGSASTLAGGMV